MLLRIRRGAKISFQEALRPPPFSPFLYNKKFFLNLYISFSLQWDVVTYTAQQQGFNNEQVLIVSFSVAFTCSKFTDGTLMTKWTPPSALTQTTHTGFSTALSYPSGAGFYPTLYFPMIQYIAPQNTLTPTLIFPWIGIPQVCSATNFFRPDLECDLVSISPFMS